MPANFSNGSSIYHGMTVNLRKRFGQRYEFLGSYTWSHAIDDSTDLQSPLSPQDNYNPSAERSNSISTSATVSFSVRLPERQTGGR